MEKIDKFIEKLQRDTAQSVLHTLYRIRLNDLSGMNIKKLQGKENGYRVRIGRIRIQFMKAESTNIITDIGFRNNNTY